MILPGKLDLAADRFTPFVTPLTISGVDLTGAVFAAQVRDAKNGGMLRADLETVGSVGTEGIKLVSTAVLGGVAYNLLSLRINEATMEAMPEGPDLDDDVQLVWDLQITPDGGVKQVYFAGSFTVRAGVTQ